MIPKPPDTVATITDAQTLRGFVAQMRARGWVALDTEFQRESTYYPKLCLVQIADTQQVGLIDAIAIDELEPLATLLADPGVLKVFHSAEQDLEVLWQRFAVMPAPLFDTQIAAALIGQDDQMGYARMIAALLDVELAKTHTRIDWRRRPLPDGALDYAADDVRYLTSAYALIRAELAERSRSDWLEPDFERMANPARFDVDTSAAWQRLKHWHRLDASAQQALAELADWREREAMHQDRPRRWILADDALMALARRRPADRSAVQSLAELPAKTSRRHGDALLACLARASRRPAQPLAEAPQPPTGHDKARIQAGMQCLQTAAEAAGIAASAIASRKDVAALVNGARDTRLLRGWRKDVAGRGVLAAIERESRS